MAAEGQQKTSGVNDSDSLSTADMAQLMALVQDASQHNPDAVPLLSSKASSPSTGDKYTSTASRSNKSSKGSAGKQSTAPGIASTSGKTTADHSSKVNTIAQPSAKKQKPGTPQPHSTKSQSSLSKLSTPAAAGTTKAPPDSAAYGAAVASGAAAAINGNGDYSVGGNADGKQKKKLGRNARLRLKRQAFRQQQEQTVTADAIDAVADAPAKVPAVPAGKQQTEADGIGSKSKAIPDRAALKATKGATEPVDRQTATVDGDKVTDSGHSNAAGTAGHPAPMPADKKKRNKKQQDLLSQASLDAAEAAPAGSSVTGKKKSSGLLERMRSKLAGGRFRMLNEQLYTSQGQVAFSMMQGQPDLFEQYHEVRPLTLLLTIYLALSVC